MGDLFPSANEGELNLISKVLKYEGRESAQDLLKSDYFQGAKNNIRVGNWISEKTLLNPYFNYLDLINTE